MNSFLKYFSILVIAVLCPAFVFAETQVPKEGDIIKISINEYDIQAKVISVTAPKPATQPQTAPQPETKAQPETTITENAPLFPADIQQGLDNFAASNPIKSGIDTFNKKITAEAVKWYHATLGKTESKPASILNAVTPFFTNVKNYWYLGLGIIFLTILFLLWKGKKKYSREY